MKKMMAKLSCFNFWRHCCFNFWRHSIAYKTRRNVFGVLRKSNGSLGTCTGDAGGGQDGGGGSCNADGTGGNN